MRQARPVTSGLLGCLALVGLLSGCGSSDHHPGDLAGHGDTAVDPDPTVTHLGYGYPSVGAPDILPGPYAVKETAPPTPPRLTLHVLRDGCTVRRSTPPSSPGLDTVSWSVRTTSGREVFGELATAGTTFRYFRPGRYVVVMTAPVLSDDDPVSNRVAVRC